MAHLPQGIDIAGRQRGAHGAVGLQRLRLEAGDREPWQLLLAPAAGESLGFGTAFSETAGVSCTKFLDLRRSALACVTARATARPGSGWLIRLRRLRVCGDSHARTVYMLLAPDVPRAHLARHPAGVNHDCRNGSFGGVPLQTQHVASSWRV